MDAKGRRCTGGQPFRFNLKSLTVRVPPDGQHAFGDM